LPRYEQRLQRIRDALGSVPISPTAVAAAFDRYRTGGALPDHRPLAIEVERRLKLGFDVNVYVQEGAAGYRRMVEETMHIRPKPPDPVLDRLVAEAVHGDGLVRLAARSALTALAESGFDVTGCPFAGHEDLVPEFGPVGFAFTGVPFCFATGPHEAKQPRLERQLAELRANAPHEDRRWFAAADRDAQHLTETGELPSDPLRRDAALLFGEIWALMERARGDDVDDVLAAFDAVATSLDSERPARLLHLQGLLRERGRAA
jgi:hypothetical protein